MRSGHSFYGREASRSAREAGDAQAEANRLRALLIQVYDRLDIEWDGAPGHCHTVPGIWDSDNSSDLARKPCEWCATWARVRAEVKGQGVAAPETVAEAVERLARLPNRGPG